MKSIYLFDTNAFINWFSNYGPDVVTGMKEKIENLIIEKRLISVREVLREIVTKTDALAEWAKENSENFLNPNEYVVKEMFNVMARYPGLINPFKSKPQSDPWIIAQALVMVRSENVKNLKVVVNDSALAEALSNEGILVCDFKEFMIEEKMQLRVS